MTKNLNEMTELDFADPIDWVYEVRRRVSERYGHDIDRYMNALRTKRSRDEAKGIRVTYARLPIARRKVVPIDPHFETGY